MEIYKFNNLYFEKVEDESSNRIDAESFAKLYYKLKGWETSFSKDLSKKIKRNPTFFFDSDMKIISNHFYEGLQEALDDENGRPDLVIREKIGEGGCDYFFVEVKTGADGLRGNQIDWIKRNPRVKVIIFYLETKGRGKEIGKTK